MKHQWYCIVGGRRYGPVSEEELRNWAQAGRIKLTDQVWSEGMSAWTPASAVAGLFTAPGGPPLVLKPHRGVVILVVGILGVVVVPCFVCGIIAWVMGSNDLAEMDAWRMNPSGRGLTQAGKICGIVGVCIDALHLVFGIIWLIMMGSMSVWHG